MGLLSVREQDRKGEVPAPAASTPGEYPDSGASMDADSTKEKKQ